MISSLSGGEANYAIIGCGVEGRGMGWYHALQLLNGEIPRARLSDVVEPFFLGAGKDLPPGKAFAKKGVQFHASVDSGSLFSGATSSTKIALIAGRTCDNPGFFRQAIKAGATHILLEKPGAPSVAELEAMAREAKAAKVPVYMGFIKNISGYVEGALAAANGAAGAEAVETKLVSRNDYTEATLQECFERNAEGMLKNMAIHEIALACQFWGMRAHNVVDVICNPKGGKDSPGCDMRTLAHLLLSMGRVRTKTVKRTARLIVEKYYGKLTLDFQVNKKIAEEVAEIQSKRLRNKIAGFTTHLMKRIQKGPA